MSTDSNPLKSIAIPNVGSLEPRGLIVVVGPNSSGKSQFLKDVHASVLGLPRKIVVCESVEITKPQDFNNFLKALTLEGHIREKYDDNNNLFLDAVSPALGVAGAANWSVHKPQIDQFYNSFEFELSRAREGKNPVRFLGHFGRWMITSLFLDRRLTLVSQTGGLDYETSSPGNELQALYISRSAQQNVLTESAKIFNKSIWVDNTRSGMLCLRVSDNPILPSAEDRIQPEFVRNFRMIEDEGDGYKSYIGICVALLLGRRPICLIDEPEMCLHPPQAYALGRFIGKHGTARSNTTIVATHSSHILRGIIDETSSMELLRFSRVRSYFSGNRIPYDVIKKTVERPSTKIETILDGIFAAAVTIVESEGDRLVYGTVWEKLFPEFKIDVHFVSVGGIGGISEACTLYKALKIPCCIIADLDLLRETEIFKKIVETIASSDVAAEILSDRNSVMQRIIALGPVLTGHDLQQQLRSLAATNQNWNDPGVIRDIRSKLSDFNSKLSSASRIKQGCESFKDNGGIYHDLKALLSKCRGVGLFLVTVGELEDWIPHMMSNGPSKRKKAEWANEAAARLRSAGPQAGDIWAFVRQTVQYQLDEASRLSGYPM